MNQRNLKKIIIVYFIFRKVIIIEKTEIVGNEIIKEKVMNLQRISILS